MQPATDNAAMQAMNNCTERIRFPSRLAIGELESLD